jgi:hypothetical protein
MNKRTIKTVAVMCSGLLMTGALWAQEIYKVVDKDGNVTFTDQPPGDGAQPMDLPPLSIIETDIQTDQAPAAGVVPEPEVAKEPTARELRTMYSDFRITQPLNEETFWGTANSVVINWGSSTPPAADMTVKIYLDGQAQPTPASGGLSLTLDRGEHQVYAELRDAADRRIVVSETVTFFVKQNSIN